MRTESNNSLKCSNRSALKRFASKKYFKNLKNVEMKFESEGAPHQRDLLPPQVCAT